MGQEARRRREKLKAMMLDEVADWTRPASVEETALLAEVERLPIVTVERMPAERLSWMRMEPRKCHVNCDWYERNDPEAAWKTVAGWWLQPYGVYMFHSVVRRGNAYACITPQAVNVPDIFEFAPDPEAVRVEDATGRSSFQRRGERMPVMVRRDPERTIRAYTLVKERILAGMDPMKAGEIDWDTL